MFPNHPGTHNPVGNIPGVETVPIDVSYGLRGFCAWAEENHRRQKFSHRDEVSRRMVIVSACPQTYSQPDLMHVPRTDNGFQFVLL